MHSDRMIGHAPRTRALGHDLNRMNTPCVGCEGCQGICAALIDAMLLPDLILKERAP